MSRTIGSMNRAKTIGVKMSDLKEIFKDSSVVFLDTRYLPILSMNSITYEVENGKAPPAAVVSPATAATKTAKTEKNGKKVKKTKKAEKKSEKIQFNILNPTAPEMATA